MDDNEPIGGWMAFVHNLAYMLARCPSLHRLLFALGRPATDSSWHAHAL
jgi:hypothetical protein